MNSYRYAYELYGGQVDAGNSSVLLMISLAACGASNGVGGAHCHLARHARSKASKKHQALAAGQQLTR